MAQGGKLGKPRQSAAKAAGEAPLRDELDRLRAVFDLSGDAIFILTADGHFLDANGEACARYGYPRDALLRRHISELDVPEERHLVPERFARLMTGKPVSFVVQRLKRDGTSIPEEVNSRKIEIGGRTFFLSVCRDIADRLRVEAERRDLEAQVQHAQKLESLGVLAGGIAHDFNNLLMGILGHVDFALTDLDPHSPIRDDLVAVEKAARRAAELSHQMLAYSGKGRFVIEPVDLGALVDEMRHILESSISKKVALRLEPAADLPPVHGDATQLRQVVMNLIINAGEAIGDRPGTIRLTTGTVACKRSLLRKLAPADDLAEGTYVFLQVVDDGCGMDAATAARIFEPFFTTKFTGRGLGLAAALGILRGHKGAVSVESAPGKGTTFRLLLPASDRGAAAPGILPPRRAATWRGRGLVLLADDEEAVRHVCGRMLDRLGFEAIVATDGEEALAIFRERHADLRAVLLDLNMPRLDGEQALAQMRSLDPHPPILLSSGYTAEQVAERFAGKGMSGFIQKPYQIDALRTALDAALASR
jgi:PAS domain S-box-containing protein